MALPALVVGTGGTVPTTSQAPPAFPYTYATPLLDHHPKAAKNLVKGRDSSKKDANARTFGHYDSL